MSPREWAVTVVLLVGSLLLFAHPFEFITGGADAGVYVNLGASIADTGAILIQDPVTAELPPALQTGLLREQPPTEETQFIRLPGFYVSETVPGEVIPQFFPLHPVWLAIAYAVAGVWGALYMTPLWAVLGVWAVFLYGRAVWRWQTGALAAFLLVISPLQMYFARYPTAEPLTQYLTWTGLWCFTGFVTYRGPRPLWGAAAALALGQVFLVRIDALPMLLLPAGWLLYILISRRWQRDEWSFWAILWRACSVYADLP